MRRLILAAFILFATACSSQANVSLIMGGSGGSNLINAYYYHPMGLSDASTNAFYARNFLISAPGTLEGMAARLNNAPGSGKSYTLTVYKNDSPTSLVVTIADTASTGENTVNTVAVVAGDWITIRVTSSGSPSQIGQWSIRFNSTDPGFSMLSGCGGTEALSRTDAQYIALAGAADTAALNETEGNVKLLIPCAGTVKNLYIHLYTAPGVGTSRTFTINKNGDPTGLTVTLSGATATGSITSDVAFSAGDFISLVGTPTDNPEASYIWVGVTFQAAVLGNFITGQSASANLSVTSSQYWACAKVAATGTATYGYVYMIGDGASVKTIYAAVDTPPGASKWWTFKLYRSGSNTGLQAVISGAAALSASGNGDISSTTYQTFYWYVTPSTSSIAASPPHVSFVLYIQPPPSGRRLMMIQ